MVDSGVDGTFLGAILIGCLLCGFASGAIASSKGLSGGGYFFLGLILGVIGIIIAAVAKPEQAAPQPPGWYRDPWNQAWYRYYDGYQWTWQLSNGSEA